MVNNVGVYFFFFDETLDCTVLTVPRVITNRSFTRSLTPTHAQSYSETGEREKDREREREREESSSSMNKDIPSHLLSDVRKKKKNHK